MSVLLIDIGNTRLKWQLRQASVIQQSGVAEHGSAWLTSVDLADCEKVLVASVKEQVDMQEVLARRFAAKLIWLSQPLLSYMDFKHCYAQPQRLGVDRWLAMLGAKKHSSGGVLVVDAGTALTVDVLDASNQHLGGYIVPGLKMAQQALFQNTDKVRAFHNEAVLSSINLGADTLGCVTAGLQRQRLAFVRSLQDEYGDYELFISGGDGEWLATQLKTNYYPHLIFDGMDSLCAGLLSV